MEGARKVTFEVLRFRPEREREPIFETYRLGCEPDWAVLDALNAVKDDVDATLSYRWSCAMGVCGSCGVLINGRPRLACSAFVREYPGTIRVEPLSNFPVVRDLVIDLESFLHKISSVKPWIIRRLERELDEGAYSQTPEELEGFRQFSMCINCALCYAACPVLAREPEFVGPAALALGHRYNKDSRDEGEGSRWREMYGREGVWSCSYANECSAVCPERVDPAMAIQQAKLNAALQWLGLVPTRGGR